MPKSESATPRARAPRRPRVIAPAPAARSLADDLRVRADSALATLLVLRPDLVHPVPADLGTLATRATTTTSVSRALDRLDRGTLQVTEALAALAEPSSVTELSSGLPGLDVDYLAEAIQRLRARALLWGPDSELHLVRTVRQSFGDYPAGLGPSMAEARRGVKVYAEQPGLVQDTVAEAPVEARDALDKLLWGPPIGRVESADRAVTPETARTPVEWLLARHLLEPLDEARVVLPREVALPLREQVLVRDLQPVAPAIGLRAERDTTQVDRTAGQQAFGFLRSTDDLLQAWSIAPPTVLRSGGLGVRDLARTATLLALDEAGAALVVETAYAAGLLASDGESAEAWAPTPAYDVWAARPMGEQWTLLAQAWLGSTRTPALLSERDEAGSRPTALSRDVDRPGTPVARRAALDAIAALEPGASPIGVDLSNYLDWKFPRRRSPLRSLVSSATLREAEELGVTGLGAMSTHGRALLVATGIEESIAEARAANRLPGRAPVPTAVVELITPMLPALLDHVLLQADLTAVAPGPLQGELAHELALVADVESTGGATTYRFRESSIRRALDAGRSASDLLSMLTTHSRTPVPQPLDYLIHDVSRRHGAVRVGIASSYIRCDDPATLSTLLAERKLSSLGLVRLADTVVAATATPDIVLERLRDNGFSPSAESADGAVLIRRRKEHRTPVRPRPPRISTDAPAPSEALVAAAVRALRAGELAATNRPEALGASGRLPRTTATESLVALRNALSEQKTVWIGYADSSGTTSERVIEPLRLEGGFLTAYDTRTAEVRTFTVARVTGVSQIADLAEPGDSTPDRPKGRA